LGAGECSRPVSSLAAGGQVAASSVGGAAPDLLGRGEMRGAVPRRAEGPLSQLLGWFYGSGRRDRPILGRGCGCSPETAMRLCRLTGADPRPGSADSAGPWSSRLEGPIPQLSSTGGAVGEDTRRLPRLVSRSLPRQGRPPGPSGGIGIPGTMARRAGDPQA
jgi:hypothetical protein